ncbi:MAG: hypothetical protein ACRD5L_16650, partial [Bryobacteraceae bacterium]
PYFPWWGLGRNRFAVVSINNFRNERGFGRFGPLHAGNRYSNLELAARDEGFRRSISTVRADRFGTGRESPAAMRNGEFRNAKLMSGNVPVVPSRDSLRASNRAANPGTIARGDRQERFFSQRQAPAVQRSFQGEASQVRQGIERSGNNGAQRGGFQQGGQRSSGAISNGPHSATGGPARGDQAPAREGWSRFGASSSGANNNGTNRGNNRVNNQGRPQTQGRPNYDSRPFSPAQQRQSGTSGARPFTQEQRPQQQNPRGNGFQNFTPQPRESRPAPQGNPNQGRPTYRDSGRGQNYRPPLSMSRPVVVPRQSPSPRGGYSSAPRGGNYSAPRGGGNQGGSRGSSRGSSGGGHSGGHGGGGHPHHL